MTLQDLKQTEQFWSDWLEQKTGATIGHFMLYGGRSLDAIRELIKRIEQEVPEN